MNEKPFTICEMSEQEVSDIAIQWAKVEGWNPGLEDAKCFYQQNRHGLFKGCFGNEVIGCCSATIYDENFAFFGLYIVKPEFRNQGYGIQMTRHRLDYVGNRNIGLDGVVDMCDKYANLGFRRAHLNARYQGQSKLQQKGDSHLVEISDELKPLVETYDRLYFPAPRQAFLNCWLTPSKNRIPLAYVDGEAIQGYGVIRRCFSGYKIGPLFAESFEIAEKIFQGLISRIDGETFYIDIPEPNQSALKLIERYHLEPGFKTWRMYTKKAPDINLNNVYGMTTLELG
jgi:GNAT superfamily N-acetyltransferase